MKKRVILAIMTVAMSMSISAQVQFSRFKYYVANIMDFSHLQLEAKFKVTGERNIKYLHVFYSPLNSVGDAIVDEDGHKYFHIYIVLALLNQRIVIQNILILIFLLVKSHLHFLPR